MQPYTEQANPITTNIDISNPREIVEKLQQCDMEMFHPAGLDYSIKTLFHDEVVVAICEVAVLCKDLLQDESRDSLVVMSGCGTSGRIAFMMARAFNRVFGKKKFAYTIAGGDKALFTSQEAPEDDPTTAKNDLVQICEGKSRILYIGITCGLSAPYVAGQLDHCMSNLEVFTPVLLGFNPVYLARNVQIPGWSKTFLDVAESMEKLSKEGKAYLINPVLLGEAITGSSRMKGGSITKVILDVILLLATSSVTSFRASNCGTILESYADSCKKFYQSASDVICSLLTSAGESLKRDDHLYYVASGGSGVLGIIDATECTPTYGADLNDVRGFIKGGYKEYDNNEGDIGQLGENYRIKTSDLASILKAAEKKARKEQNTIIIRINGCDDPLLDELRENCGLGSSLKSICENEDDPTRVVVVTFLRENEAKPKLASHFTDVHSISMPSRDFLPECASSLLSSRGRDILLESMLECWSKWLCNAVSTGAHVLRGKVMKNYMVDLKVSNQKLFHRSVGIIQVFSVGVSPEEARNFLLRSIYEVDDVDIAISKSSASTHILVATPKDKVVPTAIVMANKKCPFEEARNLLKQYHVIRTALTKLIEC